MDYKNKTVLVRDHGLFLCVAQRFVEDGWGEVDYFSDWENGAPLPDKDHIGFGVPGITRVDTYDDAVVQGKPYLIVFPDVGFGGKQERERLLGNRVFGTGRGEILEDDRVYFRKILESKKLPVSPYEVVNGGVDELREKLKKVKDKYVKISMYRGAGETFHHKDYESSRTEISRLGHVLGVLDKQVEFIIEDPIQAYVENIGMEWFVTDEGYLPSGLWGIEEKNSAYLGKACTYADIPKPMRVVADKFAPVYKKYGVRGGISLEGHITKDGSFYYDDPCMRFGSPPGEGICGAYKNFSDVMVSVAEGKVIKPEMPNKYVAIAMLQVREPGTEPIEITFPDKLYNSIRLRNLCKIDGRYYHLSQDKETIIGGAVGLSNNREDAIAQAMSIAQSVQGSGVYLDKDGFEKVGEQIKKIEKFTGRF